MPTFSANDELLFFAVAHHLRLLGFHPVLKESYIPPTENKRTQAKLLNILLSLYQEIQQ